MKNLTNAMTAELTNDRVAGGFGMLLNRMTDIAKCSARRDLLNTPPEAFVRDFAEAFRRN